MGVQGNTGAVEEQRFLLHNLNRQHLQEGPAVIQGAVGTGNDPSRGTQLGEGRAGVSEVLPVNPLHAAEPGQGAKALHLTSHKGEVEGHVVGNDEFGTGHHLVDALVVQPAAVQVLQGDLVDPHRKGVDHSVPGILQPREGIQHPQHLRPLVSDPAEDKGDQTQFHKGVLVWAEASGFAVNHQADAMLLLKKPASEALLTTEARVKRLDLRVPRREGRAPDVLLGQPEGSKVLADEPFDHGAAPDPHDHVVDVVRLHASFGSQLLAGDANTLQQRPNAVGVKAGLQGTRTGERGPPTEAAGWGGGSS